MAEKFDQNSLETVCDEINEIPDSIVFEPLTEAEIIEIISGMKNGKSSGVDKIPIHVIKNIAPSIAKPLTHILNNCINQAIFPGHFKKAEILPIFKTGNK